MHEETVFLCFLAAIATFILVMSLIVLIVWVRRLDAQVQAQTTELRHMREMLMMIVGSVMEVKKS